MRTKLTLVRAEGRRTDLVIGADATATVGDAARALFLGDPLRRGEEVPDALTLRVLGPGGGTVLDPVQDLADASLRSGATVELVSRSSEYAGPGEGRGPAVAVVRVIGGADAGREFPVPAGVTSLGRDRDVDIRLSDPLVSKRHCRLNVGSAVEVIDTDSANGVLVGGVRVTRAVVGAGDVVALGDTEVVVVPLQRAAAATPSPSVEVLRSPRVVRRFPEREIPGPKPPEPPQGGRFPILAMLAPLAMGAVLWFTTHQVLSLVFVALSPLLMLGTWLDQRLTARRTLRAQREAFARSCDAIEEMLDREHAVERAVRLSRHPSVAECVEAVERVGPLLWTHRSEHDEFLTVRLGVGSARSALSLRIPAENNTLPDAWDRLLAVADHAARVDGVPAVGDLRSAGAIGVCGGNAVGVVTGLVFQLAALHSPADLAVACAASAATRETWSWLGWLPHTGVAGGPLGGVDLADNLGAGAALLERLEALVEERLEATGAAVEPLGPLSDVVAASVHPPVLPAVVLVVDDDTPLSRARLVRVAERGAAVGVHVVWVAERVERLPAVCRTFVVTGEAGSTVGEVRTGDLHHPVEVEALEPARALGLARLMAPLTDATALSEDDSDLPAAVAYPALAQVADLDDPSEIAERWRQVQSVTPRDGQVPDGKRKGALLTGLVGMGAAAPLAIDLRRHGPHALVGGTTGAGKSEFLQSWVMGMARANSPDRLVFLFVDYKGGAAFADCLDLPHSVGLVTDLSPHLVRRALTSLRAELRYREHLLNRKKVKDLATLERTWDPDTPPSLVIVVDEFAALATEVPEFVDGVVDVAQRGRSLGLHLILATQRPAGVIKDNLRANTNLRIALRLADADDSLDVLGVPDAASFDPTIPGRAAMKTGPGRIQTFQTGYVGGWTSTEPRPARPEITGLGFNLVERWELPDEDDAVVDETGPNDISRMVGAIRRAAGELGVPQPRRPWLPELARTYDLARLQQRSDEALVIGVVDEPEHQRQSVAYFHPDADGNLGVYGAGGSGKSTALRTIALAAGITPRGGPVHVYGLDFGSRGLAMLEGMPHVGAVIAGDDRERVARLLRWLRGVIDERAERFAAVNAGTIVEYRRLAEAADLPRILVLLDGMAAFREAYDTGLSAPLFTLFEQIAADGRPVGVHVVASMDRPGAISPALRSTFQRRLVLRLAEDSDYGALDVPSDVVGPGSPAGRGLLDGAEIQVAVLSGSANLADQSQHVRRLAAAIADNEADRLRQVAPIQKLPEDVALQDLPPTVGDRLALAIEDESLGPWAIEPRGLFVVTGPPGSGRSTALHTIAAALARVPGMPRATFLAPGPSGLAGLPLLERSATGPDDVHELVARLVEDAGRSTSPRALLIEDLASFIGTPAEYALENALRVLPSHGWFVIVESEISRLSHYGDLVKIAKSARRGVVLQPDQGDGDAMFRTEFPYLRRREFPPGRGFVAERGRVARVQWARP